MGLYIEKMELPKGGNETIIRILPNGEILDQYGHHLGLSALSVPPHGELKDADAIRADIDEKRPGRSYEDAWALTVIDAAPTIIPADHIVDATKMVNAEEGE